jgi:hypothetical protein
MTRPWNLEASTYEAVTSTANGQAGQLPAPADVARAGRHDHLAGRAEELHTSLQAVRVEFEARRAKWLAEAGEFRRLGEVAHEHAEEVDDLLGLLVRCNAPEALIQEAEHTFDALRDLEEQITGALEWNSGMGRHLVRLGRGSNSQQSNC